MHGRVVRPVILAHEPPFRLGELRVCPATRQLVLGSRSETIEPRVMQVLVALAAARGEVVSRDELIDRCWDGRIVTDNAINRVISRIRQIAAEFAPNCFRLETITKVGYRIVIAAAAGATAAPAEAAPPDQTAASPGRIGRRAALAAAAALFGAGLWWWAGGRRGETGSAEARALYERGLEAQREGVFDQERQAAAYFRQAVTLDVEYGDAWGALALAYCGRIGAAPVGEQEGWATRSRSAAQRALAIDPDNADARAALILLRPSYRNWAAAEASIRGALEEGIDHPLLYKALGHLLMEVGRCREAVEPIEAMFVRERTTPTAHYARAGALLGAGRIEEAEATLDAALKLWPSHPDLWFSRFYGLAYSGRPAAAIAIASDRTSRPYGYSEEGFELALDTVRAMESRTPDAGDRVIGRRLAQLSAGKGSPGLVAQNCAALGRTDLAFDLLNSYFFGGGPLAPRWPAPGPFTHRNSAILFLAPLAALHPDPRFAELTRATRLEAYWRSSGSVPDFRRNA